MNYRVILEALIRRLEPKVAGLRTELDHVRESEQGAKGLWHLRDAYDDARQALASGDEAKIKRAAVSTQMLERKGGEMRKVHQTRAAGRHSKRREWADVLAEHIDSWSDIPDARSPLEIEGQDRDYRCFSS